MLFLKKAVNGKDQTFKARKVITDFLHFQFSINPL